MLVSTDVNVGLDLKHLPRYVWWEPVKWWCSVTCRKDVPLNLAFNAPSASLSPYTRASAAKQKPTVLRGAHASFTEDLKNEHTMCGHNYKRNASVSLPDLGTPPGTHTAKMNHHRQQLCFLKVWGDWAHGSTQMFQLDAPLPAGWPPELSVQNGGLLRDVRGPCMFASMH